MPWFLMLKSVDPLTIGRRPTLSTSCLCSTQKAVGATKIESDSLSDGLTSLVTVKRDQTPQEDILKHWLGLDASNSHDDSLMTS